MGAYEWCSLWNVLCKGPTGMITVDCLKSGTDLHNKLSTAWSTVRIIVQHSVHSTLNHESQLLACTQIPRALGNNAQYSTLESTTGFMHCSLLMETSRHKLKECWHLIASKFSKVWKDIACLYWILSPKQVIKTSCLHIQPRKVVVNLWLKWNRFRYRVRHLRVQFWWFRQFSSDPLIRQWQ